MREVTILIDSNEKEHGEPWSDLFVLLHGLGLKCEGNYLLTMRVHA